MKRWLTALLILVVLGAATILASLWLRGHVEPPIRVGFFTPSTDRWQSVRNQ